MFCGPDLPDRGRHRPDPLLARLPRRQARPGRLAGRVLDHPEDPDYPEAAWGRRVYTIAALYAGDADEGEAVLAAAARAGRDGDRLLRPDALLRPPAAVRYRDPVRPAPLLLEEPLSWRPRRRRDRPLVDGNARRLRQHAVLDLELRRRHRRVEADATAFGDRSMPWMFSIDSIWSGRRGRGEHRLDPRLLGRLEPYSRCGRMYLNFAGPRRGQRASSTRRTFGANYERLEEIKRRYDPTTCSASTRTSRLSPPALGRREASPPPTDRARIGEGPAEEGPSLLPDSLIARASFTHGFPHYPYPNLPMALRPVVNRCANSHQRIDLCSAKVNGWG